MGHVVDKACDGTIAPSRKDRLVITLKDARSHRIRLLRRFGKKDVFGINEFANLIQRTQRHVPGVRIEQYRKGGCSGHQSGAPRLAKNGERSRRQAINGPTPRFTSSNWNHMS